MIMRAPLSTLALEDGTLRASELTLRPHFQLMSCSLGRRGGERRHLSLF